MTFVPRNLIQREAIWATQRANRLEVYQARCLQFKAQLAAVQGLTSPEPQENLWLTMLQDLTVYTDQITYPFSLILFNAQGQYVLEYNWLSNTWYCHYGRGRLVFEKMFGTDLAAWRLLLTVQTTKHFGRDATNLPDLDIVEHGEWYTQTAELHFKIDNFNDLHSKKHNQ